MVEQARAQLVDHALADRDGDEVGDHVEHAEQRVQDDEADACGDEQLGARHRRNPRAHERHAAQHVVDYNFERPRLEHFGGGGEEHAGDRNRETAEMRAHPAQRVTVEFQRGHGTFSISATEIPSVAATSAAQVLMMAGMRLARLIASTPTPSATKITPTIPAPIEDVAARSAKIIAAATSARRGVVRMRKSIAMLRSLRRNAFIGTRIIGGTTISRS